MNEEWRPVVGYEGFYEVSNLGYVRSLYRSGATLKGQVSTQGHHFVHLSLNGSVTRTSVHRIVANAFIPNPDKLPMVLHWDDVPGNNRVENLRWGTRSDNARDAARNGKHPNSRKTHCRNRHEFTTENTYIRSDTGARRCRECTLEGNRSSKRKG